MKLNKEGAEGILFVWVKAVEHLDREIILSISTALTRTFPRLVHRPHESDLALHCAPRKLQATLLRLSDLIDLTFLLGMEGLLL